VSDDTIKLSISLRSAFDFLHVMYVNGKQMLVLNFIFHLLWTGMGSSVSAVALVGLCDLNWIDNLGSELTLVCVMCIFI
jgi:hypothetical protein